MNPILDRPQTVDHDQIKPDALFRLANQDLVFHVNGDTDLHDLFWPWADQTYARRLEVHVSDLHDDMFMPMVTQFFPGYQETIYGTEGMIVSKRLVAPYKTAYDRAAIWVLECQAEGDRLLRVEIDIDWGEPLTQRMVDGLLVAQRNPQGAQGIYSQHNADSTRVFGNPHGRPEQVTLDDDGHAHLVYYVLVNGMVEVPFMLTVSDVGEQVAWNGFLALRDAERAFELSVDAWRKLLTTGRVWTPDPHLNQSLQAGRIATVQHIQRLRTGLAPADRDVRRLPALVESSDSFDPVQSRNLLAHLRRVAERTHGALPVLLPTHPKEPVSPPGDSLAETNGAYLSALLQHLSRHFDGELLSQHREALVACAERLVKDMGSPTAEQPASVAAYLDAAATLAGWGDDSANQARWQSEAAHCRTLARGHAFGPEDSGRAGSLTLSSQVHTSDLWELPDPWSGIELCGRFFRESLGLRATVDGIQLAPSLPPDWSWWALLDLPLYTDEQISLVWDGTVLHATAPVQAPWPVARHHAIRALYTDEHDFDLQFEFVDETDDGRVSTRFRPVYQSAPASGSP